MLFSKNIDPCCVYCSRGNKISPSEVMCLKRGVVDAGGFCRYFKYDPLKREPARPIPLKKDGFSPEDFEL